MPLDSYPVVLPMETTCRVQAANQRRAVVSEPFGLFAFVISSASQSVTIARAVTSGGYGGNVVSRVSSTGPPTVKW